MNVRNTLAVALLGCMPLLAACDRQQAAAPHPASEPTSALGSVVKHATDRAREKLATQNIDISDGAHIEINGHRFDRPSSSTRAEITPQGDLLIDGKPAPVDAAQRALLLRYRQEIIGVAGAGMDIGVQGADLGMKAASEAISGIFSGNTDHVEDRVKAEATKIETAAMKLCDMLPPMLSTQQELAATLPAFKPYANMTQEDISDCRNHHGSADEATRTRIREEIRRDIRGTVRASVQGARGESKADESPADAAQAPTRK